VTSKAFDEVWCVFDKDDFPDQDFNQAIVLASAKGFRVAYSNQAFEYWLLLHFNDHQGGALHRNHYADLINRAIQPLGAWYDATGSKVITPEFFHLLFGYDAKYRKRRVDLAIERAKRIYDRYPHQSPAEGGVFHHCTCFARSLACLEPTMQRVRREVSSCNV